MRTHAALALVILSASLGCAAAPPAAAPRPITPRGEATVALLEQPKPAAPPAAAPPAPDAEEAQKDADRDSKESGTMWGDQIGDSFGSGGLGLAGEGAGGGGRAGSFGGGSGTSGSRAKVAAATASVTAGLPPEVIQRIIRAHVSSIRRCYEAALGKSPALAGKLAVSFTINAKGDVASASAGDTTISDAAMVTCVLSAVKGIQFPAPESGVVQVTYPFHFSPGDS